MKPIKTLKLRGAIKKKKTEKGGLLDQQGGGGLTESQLFVKFFQNQICLGTVHKCDETHTTQMGRQYLINSGGEGVPLSQPKKTPKMVNFHEKINCSEWSKMQNKN